MAACDHHTYLYIDASTNELLMLHNNIMCLEYDSIHTVIGQATNDLDESLSKLV